jgi:hypothetical protein
VAALAEHPRKRSARLQASYNKQISLDGSCQLPPRVGPTRPCLPSLRPNAPGCASLSACATRSAAESATSVRSHRKLLTQPGCLHSGVRCPSGPIPWDWVRHPRTSGSAAWGRNPWDLVARSQSGRLRLAWLRRLESP